MTRREKEKEEGEKEKEERGREERGRDMKTNMYFLHVGSRVSTQTLPGYLGTFPYFNLPGKSVPSFHSFTLYALHMRELEVSNALRKT